MKKKFSSMGRVAIALVLALSLCMVMAAPVAADVTDVTVDVDNPAISVISEYTIDFTTTVGMTSGVNSIVITFPEDTTINDADIATDEVTVNTIGVADDKITVVGLVATIVVPANVPAGAVTVVFLATAEISNPSTADSYNLNVHTDVEPEDIISAAYSITVPPGPVDIYDAAGVYTGTSKSTIQAAIDDAATVADCTLKVHAGTYTGNVIIDKSITLESMDGAATTIIDASATDELTDYDRPPTGVLITSVLGDNADGATLGGPDKGFTIITPDNPTGDDDDCYGVEVSMDIDDVTVEGNVITGNTGKESPKMGIHMWPGDAGNTDITIKDNTISTTYTSLSDWSYDSIGIWSGDLNGSNVLIDGNNVTGFSRSMYLDGLNGTDADNPIVISNNIVTGAAYSSITVVGDFVQINDNVISGNGGNGIGIDAANVKVYQNDIHGNGNGVKVYTNAASVSIQYNDIYANTNTTLPADPDESMGTYENYGVCNAVDATNLDAKYNWWGEIGGPASATYAEDEVADWWAGTALGNGDIVAAVDTSTVLYAPWLTEVYDTVVTDGIRSYGSDALELAVGWNTLSVPCGLKGSADTFGAIQAMGDYLTDFVGGYWFDAASIAWVGIDNDTTLEPGKGFYVNMSDESRFPVLYFDGSLYLPAYDMYAGWNLIGAMFGIDDTDFGVEETGTMTCLDALDSIQASGSVIISPSVPGQTTMWATTVADNAGPEFLCVGEAYWVFMTADGTLAGFEVTPFYFTWAP